MYNPQWTDEVLGYATKYLVKNQWILRPEMELDDALQESYLLFLRLVECYDFENPRHFMNMWKVALHNKVWHQWRRDHAHWRQEQLNYKAARSIVARPSELGLELHSSQATGYVRRLLEVAEALEAARVADPPVADTPVPDTAAPKATSRIRRPRRRRNDGTRLTTNEYLCRFAGISTGVPLRRLFEEWLVST